MAESAEHSPIEEKTPAAKEPKYDLLEHFPVKHDTPPKKVLFLGDENIGKSTFIKKYCEQVREFHKCDGYAGSRWVFTQFLVYHSHEEKSILIRLLDLPSGSTEESRKDQYPDEIDMIVLCFAVDNPTSFANVWKIWIPEFKKHNPDFTRFYLLGLRSDLREEMLAENKTPVTLERGTQIHQKHKFRGDYMECSVAKNPTQAIDLMSTLISDLFATEPPPVSH